MTEADIIFFELIQIALGNHKTLSRTPTEVEWKAIFANAQKQAIVGLAFDALEGLVNNGMQISKALLLEWIGINERIKQRNILVNQRCKELEKLFVDGGYKSCILKGQGSALYYQNPLCRQSGDIDVWIEGARHDILDYVKKKDYHIGHVDIKHSDIGFFEDVHVEVHFIPSWMYNPIKNRKLQNFFSMQKMAQFGNYDESVGFTHTTVQFDLVFSLVHIYRHLFDEGIGLRQLLDYYHILLHSEKQQRVEAIMVLKGLGMKSFTEGLMWVLKECFALKERFYLCDINEHHGSFLLSEILIAGNFGHYDSRIKHQESCNRFAKGLVRLKRNIRFLRYYPSEVLWSPIWKLWHWCWRKKMGFL